MIGTILALVLAFLPSSKADCDQQRLKAVSHRAQIIAVVKVVEVEPSPGLWSGQFAFAQYVRYEIERVIKGSLTEHTIRVAHTLVANAVTVDPDKPRLSPKIFAKGNRLVLFLEYQEGKGGTLNQPQGTYVSLNDYCLPRADEETIKLIEEYVATLSPSSTPDWNEQLSTALAQRAEMVVVAKVIKVEPPLGLWSGYHAIGQHVKYEIEEVIKGKLAEREVYVAHGIWKNASTVDTEQARLSPKLFVKGNRFVLFLVTENNNGYITRTHPAKAYLSLNDNCLPTADAETVKLIRGYAESK